MIIIYHNSYGTRLHLCLPTMRSNIAHLYWCHKQWSLSTIIVPAYIYFNIPGCYYFSSIYAHRPEVHRSAERSVVGLDALRCEQCQFCCRLSCIALRAMLVVCQQLFSLQRFLTLPSTEADQTLPLVYIHPWLHSSFCCIAICALHRAVFVSSFALHRCNARRSSSATSRNISTFVQLHSCLLVICLL